MHDRPDGSSGGGGCPGGMGGGKAAGRSRCRQKHPGQERDGLCHQRRSGGAGVSAGALGGPDAGRPVHGRGAGQQLFGLEPPLLDFGPGGRHHQPDPSIPAQRDFPGLGGGWTNCLWYGIQSLYGGVFHRPPGRRSIPKWGSHSGQRRLSAGG